MIETYRIHIIDFQGNTITKVVPVPRRRGKVRMLGLTIRQGLSLIAVPYAVYMLTCLQAHAEHQGGVACATDLIRQ